MVKQYSEPVPAVETTTPVKHERPFALKVVCALLMFEGLLLLVVAFAVGYEIYVPNGTAEFPPLFSGFLSGFGVVTEMLILGVGGAVLVWVAIGLWRLSPWAWRWTMITIGVLLVINLWNYSDENQTRASTFALLIDILIVFYLVQPEVRRLYIDKPKVDAKHEPS